MGLKEDVDNIKKNIADGCYNINKLVTTTDYWCPNYPEDKVKVSMAIYDEDDEVFVKIDVWGMDDTGYELVYTESNSLDGYYMADRVWTLWKWHIYDKVPEGVDIDWFLDRGFLWG